MEQIFSPMTWGEANAYFWSPKYRGSNLSKDTDS